MTNTTEIKHLKSLSLTKIDGSTYKLKTVVCSSTDVEKYFSSVDTEQTSVLTFTGVGALSKAFGYIKDLQSELVG